MYLYSAVFKMAASEVKLRFRLLLRTRFGILNPCSSGCEESNDDS